LPLLPQVSLNIRPRTRTRFLLLALSLDNLAIPHSYVFNDVPMICSIWSSNKYSVFVGGTSYPWPTSTTIQNIQADLHRGLAGESDCNALLTFCICANVDIRSSDAT
jgi:hypothetical protein